MGTPGEPSHPHHLYQSAFDWFEVRRWNWGLIALFYVVWLTEAVATRPGRRPNEETAGAPHPLRPRLAGQRSSLVALATTCGAGVLLGMFWPWWSCAVSPCCCRQWVAETVASGPGRRPGQGTEGDPHLPQPRPGRLTFRPPISCPRWAGDAVRASLGWMGLAFRRLRRVVVGGAGHRSSAVASSASTRSGDPRRSASSPQSQPSRPMTRPRTSAWPLPRECPVLGLLWSWSWWSSP